MKYSIVQGKVNSYISKKLVTTMNNYRISTSGNTFKNEDIGGRVGSDFPELQNIYFLKSKSGKKQIKQANNMIHVPKQCIPCGLLSIADYL